MTEISLCCSAEGLRSTCTSPISRSATGGSEGPNEAAVYRCLCKGMILAGFETSSEKIAELRKGQCVAVTRSSIVKLQDRTKRVPFECIWSLGGPNFGSAGWTSMVSGSGSVVLEEIPAAEAEQWQKHALEILCEFMGRQGVDVDSAIAQLASSEATQRWKKQIVAINDSLPKRDG